MKLIKRLIISLLLRINLPFVFNKFWSDYLVVHISPNSYFRYWFINPFNGQSKRLYTFYGLVHKLKPTIGIETGTYFGSSTWLFFGMNLKEFHSIEVNEKYAEVARVRHARELEDKNLQIHTGNSSDVMRIILSQLPKSERVIAYLDAHWESNIPTAAEVESLVNWGGPWIALIDDFKVETDLTYGFDTYLNTEIGMNLLLNSQNFYIYLPSETSEHESGARRGTAYLIGKVAMDTIGSSLIDGLPLRLFEFPINSDKE
jgi:hypothetical protein